VIGRVDKVCEWLSTVAGTNDVQVKSACEWDSGKGEAYSAIERLCAGFVRLAS
jgi:hypothetical protein